MKNTKSVCYRVPENWVETMRELPDVVGFSQQQLINDALAILFGKKDDMVAQRHQMVMEAIKKGKVNRPFNSAPDSHDVICTTA
jgi:hypothetical protein